jgi:hypothetical protein
MEIVTAANMQIRDFALTIASSFARRVRASGLFEARMPTIS